MVVWGLVFPELSPRALLEFVAFRELGRELMVVWGLAFPELSPRELLEFVAFPELGRGLIVVWGLTFPGRAPDVVLGREFKVVWGLALLPWELELWRALFGVVLPELGREFTGLVLLPRTLGVVWRLELPVLGREVLLVVAWALVLLCLPLLPPVAVVVEALEVDEPARGLALV